jgi:energy-coupling factor transporter ATP-binding protein EcfA2
VLDEPTTGLDAESEAQVMESLATLMQGRTTVLITHSLALALTADRVVVLDASRVVQEGSPAALLAAAGPFRHLAAEQGLVPQEPRGRHLSSENAQLPDLSVVHPDRAYPTSAGGATLAEALDNGRRSEPRRRAHPVPDEEAE